MENRNFNRSNKNSKVTEWWGVTFSGKCEKQNDKFVIKMGGDSFFNMTVAELIPGKKVVWLVTDCNMPWYSDKKEWLNAKCCSQKIKRLVTES